MATKFRVAFLGAIFFGLIAAYGIYNFLVQQRAAALALKVVTERLVVASKDIPPGQKLTTEMTKIASWTKSSIPEGTFSDPKQVVDKIVKLKIHAGDPITKAKLGTLDDSGLTVRVAPGYRAMAVKVDEVIGVSGFIAPNDRVDVITTIDPPGQAVLEKVSKIVLQNTRVLAVAQTMEETSGRKPKVVRSITLEVTPAESERLSLASIEGKIILSLRAVGDEKTVSTSGSKRQDLLAMAGPAKGPIRPVARKHQVEMYSGGSKSVLEF